ncbi:efflux RND transporter permease subunit [Nodosilinea sp. LEGE 06152]|uniref:efflux RND transporter permease subunit n=1 Tax=Nodosilinea sp. LEGE 06152 TaxID=2777966 RepID=UPI00187FCB2C|nr:efflux RND transporter permease subunit [Nodosilinea sp. LEGE 06152]MBE9155971.1 efflux RND transporter permease subunit [Nodosilinea sp. LEGE 06152]
MDLFYRNRQLLLLTLVLIVVWGLSAFLTLPRLEDPEIVQRFARVTTFLPGATPERVETLVTEKIEDRLFELEEVESLRSTSGSGISVITVELKETIPDVDPVWAKVRSKVDDAVADLPAAASVPEYADSSTKASALIVGLTWTRDDAPNYAILGRLAAALEDRLRAIPGTETVDVFGEPDEEIRVDIAATELSQLGLTAQGLAQQIAASDAKVSAGQYRSASSEFLLEVDSSLSSLEQIRAIPIRAGVEGQVARLGDVATVTRAVQDPPPDLALVNGHPAIALAAKVESGQRVDQWAVQAQRVLDDFRRELPQGLDLQVVLDQSQYVQQRLNGVVNNLITGSVLVIGVSLLILGWKSALLVGLALPLTTLMVFGTMKVLGVPLHQMSVTGIIIALGLLIDNAIIAVDEVQGRLGQGMPPAEAVAQTVRHLLVPLLASTLTTVLAFVPIATSPGGVGEFIGTIGLTVILALLSSLALSLTVILALAGRLHQWNPLPQRWTWLEQGFSNVALANGYRWTLRAVFCRPWLGVGLSLILPVMGFAVFATLPQQFFPPTNRNQFQIEFELPTQTALSATQAQIRQARELALTHPEIDDVHWFLGRSAPPFFYNVLDNRRNAQNYAQGIVQLAGTERLRETIQTLQREMDAAFPQAQVLVKQLEQGPPFDAPIELRVYGSDLTGLRDLGDRLRAELAQVPNVVHTRATLTEALPKLALMVDEAQARRLGLDNQSIAGQLNAALDGRTGGSVLDGTRDIPVRVRVPEDQQGDLGAIASLDMVTTAGNLPLDAIASLDLVPDIASISRRNGQRINTVQGFITAGSLPSTVLAAFQQRLTAQGFELPPGYRIEYGGEADARGTAVGNLLSTVGVLMILMTATLVLSFNSFGLAALIGTVAILSVGLAALALKLFGSIFGFTAILGTLGLIGLAINDSIVVLAALREHPEAKLGHPQAVEAVVFHATRHVIATTVTTIIGFVPLMIDPTGFWPPLAIAIAGGLGGATLLALYYIPSAYRLLTRWSPAPVTKAPAELVPTAAESMSNG